MNIITCDGLGWDGLGDKKNTIMYKTIQDETGRDGKEEELNYNEWIIIPCCFLFLFCCGLISIE